MASFSASNSGANPGTHASLMTHRFADPRRTTIVQVSFRGTAMSNLIPSWFEPSIQTLPLFKVSIMALRESITRTLHSRAISPVGFPQTP